MNRDLFAAAGGIVEATSDPYFNSTTLLLNGDGTNGAQNNTFIDSSTNNFTVTRSGTPTQGTFTPFSQTGWSGYFNGTTDALSLPASANLAIGTGDFTVEMWVYATLANNSATVGGSWPRLFTLGTAQGTGCIEFYIVSGTTAYVQIDAGTITFTTSILFNSSWNHFAITRSGTAVKAFVNGTQVGTTLTNSSNINLAATTNSWIGAIAASTACINAYISNFRIVKGTALYTAAFTPPTAPLTAVSGTSLVTLQSNRFKDNSINNFTITPGGTPSIQAFSPFAPTAAYDVATVGGSIYFNGTTDRIVKSGAADTLTADYTIEFWIYFNVASGFQTPITTFPGSNGILLQTYGVTFYFYPPNNVSSTFTSFVFTPYQWYHIAMVRSGTTLTAYVNGTALTPTTTFSGTIDIGTICIGDYTNGTAYPLNGYISNLRIVKSAVYTANFTPSTTPLTAISNTSLLLSGTNAGIYDATARNDLITVGNAQVSSTQIKYGTGSMYFDGTGDYLSVNPIGAGDLGTGNFTIEYWMKASAAGSFIGPAGTQEVSGSATAGMWRCLNRLNSANGIYFAYTTGSAFVDITFTTTNYNDSTWHHIAYVKSGTSLKAYVDGTQVGTAATVTQSLTSGKRLTLGYNPQDNAYYTGYVDDLRITKGVARYTANFTPPTTAMLGQ